MLATRALTHRCLQTPMEWLDFQDLWLHPTQSRCFCISSSEYLTAGVCDVSFSLVFLWQGPYSRGWVFRVYRAQASVWGPKCVRTQKICLSWLHQRAWSCQSHCILFNFYRCMLLEKFWHNPNSPQSHCMLGSQTNTEIQSPSCGLLVEAVGTTAPWSKTTSCTQSACLQA